MAHGKVEQQIDALRALRDAGPTPSTVAALRKGLANTSGLVTAQAAKIAGELRLSELVPDLLRAFDRLFENPVDRDPQCWGKNAIARALTELDYRESDPFLQGARHIQMEPVWGGQEDTASQMRGVCVLALASCTDIRREEIFRCLVDHLTEKAYTVRMEAARAIAQMDGDEAPLLLRLKARAGDEETRVIGQVFDCILELEGERAVGFLRDFVDHGSEEAQSEAALSLGSSRLPGAIAALEEAWGATRNPDLRLVILRALSASRQERALEFLLELVTKGRPRDAASALDALSLHKESEEIRKQVEAAAREGGSSAEEMFHKAFR